METKYNYQIIKLTVSKANERVRIDTETELKHKRVIGMFVSEQTTDTINNSELTLKIDEEEILPNYFGANIIQTNKYLSRKDVELEIDEKAEGSKVEGWYQDKPIQNVATSYPYDVKIYLITTNED